MGVRTYSLVDIIQIECCRLVGNFACELTADTVDLDRVGHTHNDRFVDTPDRIRGDSVRDAAGGLETSDDAARRARSRAIFDLIKRMEIVGSLGSNPNKSVCVRQLCCS